MSKPRSLTRAAAVVTLAAAALLAAGCGGSSESDTSSGTSPTTEWADGLCTAISDWTSSISSIGDTIKGGDLSKDSLTSAVDDAKSATETFTSDLDGLGKPDTDAGQEAKDSIDQLSSELKDEVATIQDELDGASGITGLDRGDPRDHDVALQHGHAGRARRSPISRASMRRASSRAPSRTRRAAMT